MYVMDKILKDAKEKINEKARELGNDLLEIVKNEVDEMAGKKIHTCLEKNDSKIEKEEIGHQLHHRNDNNGTGGEKTEIYENIGGGMVSIRQDSLSKIENEIKSVLSKVNPIIGRVLEAQMEVFRFIREPMLAPSITDTIIQKLEMSLRYATTREEQRWLKEQCSVIIQNYLFLIHATLLYETKENKDEGIRLLQDAIFMIGKAIEDVLTFGGFRIPNIAASLCMGIIKNINTKNQSLLSEIFGFLNKRIKLKRKKKEFMLMAERTVFKIARRRYLLGKSIILSEMIYNFAELIDDHKKELAKAASSRIFSNVGFIMFLIIFLSAIVLAILGLIHLVEKERGSMEYLPLFIATYGVLKWLNICIVGTGTAVMIFVPMILKLKSKRLKNQLIKLGREFDPSQ